MKKEIERIADLRKKQKVHNSQDQEVSRGGAFFRRSGND